MTLARSLLKYILALFLIVVALQNKVYAGGFPLRPGRLLLAPSINYFTASKQWDGNGILSPFPNHGKFNSVSTILYAEYGLSRRFSIVASLPYIINNYSQDNYNPGTISGLTDLETGIKYYLANIGYRYYFSIQGTAITPLYKKPNLGYGQSGAEFRAAFAGGGTLFGQNYYFNIEDGIRQYFGSVGPVQDRYSATFGLSLDKSLKNQLSVSFSGFYTTSKYNKTLTPYQIANFYTSTNFSFKQLSLSYGHSFTKQLTMVISGGKFVAGRNTGNGTSGSLSLIYHIDTR
ncbi:MAG: hypothetical protein JWR54_2718 [Mucilaginibacter sp.]|nr:hypothetical protein [Mucilaginibacter sp.]